MGIQGRGLIRSSGITMFCNKWDKRKEVIFKGTGFQLKRVSNGDKLKINSLESEINQGFIFRIEGKFCAPVLEFVQ